MIAKDKIALHEAGNDGRTLFLYYDGLAGLYLAFGLSPTTLRWWEPCLSYSDEQQMPVALLQRDHILLLRQGLEKVEHRTRHSFRFCMRTTGESGTADYV